jgi:hypothetical protein
VTIVGILEQQDWDIRGQRMWPDDSIVEIGRRVATVQHKTGNPRAMALDPRANGRTDSIARLIVAVIDINGRTDGYSVAF